MSRVTPSQSIKYTAVIANVKEVALYGHAGLAYWERELQKEGLSAWNDHGQAAILITATDLKWKGMPFRELTISVYARNANDARAPEGFYLIRAFNSSRMLSFMERAFFRTPYSFGHTQVKVQSPVAFLLALGQQSVIKAMMSGQPRDVRYEDQDWEGSIFLPSNASDGTSRREQCFARLGGRTAVCPFLAAADVFELNPPAGNGCFRQLAESCFAPKEWRTRDNAAHARSATYARA
jgi:hypothetical protein